MKRDERDKSFFAQLTEDEVRQKVAHGEIKPEWLITLNPLEESYGHFVRIPRTPPNWISVKSFMEGGLEQKFDTNLEIKNVGFKIKRKYAYPSITFGVIGLFVFVFALGLGLIYIVPILACIGLIIIGVRSLNKEVVFLKEDSVVIKIALLSIKQNIKYTDIESIITSEKNKLIIDCINRTVYLNLKWFDETDKEEILQELKARSGK
ncbi:MAG: hypothetical protein MUO72_11090 [Bacteroidales bacterium]|nr:hypothetical protein [Bacteroidales bacterium]